MMLPHDPNASGEGVCCCLRCVHRREAATQNALVRARTFLAWTQDEMAHALGLSTRTYQRREALADEAVPKAERIAAGVFLLSSEQTP